MKKYLIMFSLVLGFLFTSASALTISQNEEEFTQTVKDYITIQNGSPLIQGSKWNVDYTIDFNTINITFEEAQMDISIDVTYNLLGNHVNTFYLEYALDDNEFHLSSMKWGYFPLIKPLREAITKDLTIINMQANNLILFDKEVINQDIKTTDDTIDLDLSLNISSILSSSLNEAIDLFKDFSEVATNVSKDFDNNINDEESSNNNSLSYTNSNLVELLNDNSSYLIEELGLDSFEINDDYIKIIYSDYDLKITGSFDVHNNSLVYSYDSIKIKVAGLYVPIPNAVLSKIQESFLENTGDIIDSDNQNIIIPNEAVEFIISQNNETIEITSIEKEKDNIIIYKEVS